MPSAIPGNKFSYWLSDLIYAEDKQPRYNSFWSIWQLMQEYIIMWYDKQINKYKKTCDAYFFDSVEEVLMYYLLAFPNWSERIHEWHSLKQENNSFYYVMSNRLGYNPTTLYSITHIFNTIGKNILICNGIDWISHIIKNNSHLCKITLSINTIYYI